MHVVHSWLNESEKQEARDLGAQLQRGEIEALRKLEPRVLRATKDNEHFTEWFSEVVRYVMSDQARAKLGPKPRRGHRNGQGFTARESRCRGTSAASGSGSMQDASRSTP